MTTSESNETVSMTFNLTLQTINLTKLLPHKTQNTFQFPEFTVFLLLALHTDGRSTIISVLNVASLRIFYH